MYKICYMNIETITLIIIMMVIIIISPKFIKPKRNVIMPVKLLP